MKARLLFAAMIAAAYLALFITLDFLRFDVAADKDEGHFWPTTLRFAERPFPSLDLLRDYGELNTPLPFIIFGWLEHFFHGGIPVGRVLNFILSLGIVCLILLAGRAPPPRPMLCAIGLLLFPYYLGVSCYLYTDIIAAAFVIVGVHLHVRRRPIPAAIAFILAIASRQYMLAFPLAVAAHEFIQSLQSRRPLRTGWIAPLIAAASIFGWYGLFGGPAPTRELAEQHITTAGVFSILPHNCLYFLACIGVYYVIPEYLLLSRRINLGALISLRNAALAALLLVLFILFPPIQNVGYNIPTMGYFDKAVRLVLHDHHRLRMALFYGCALMTCLRFNRVTLPALLLLINAALMMKAHIAWDKYTLPLLVSLWYLAADTRPELPTDSRSPSPDHH